MLFNIIRNVQGKQPLDLDLTENSVTIFSLD